MNPCRGRIEGRRQHSESLPRDPKISKLTRRRRIRDLDLADICSHSRFDRSLKRRDRVDRPLGNELNSAVGKIPYVPGDVKPGRDLHGGLAEADSLHASVKVDRAANDGPFWQERLRHEVPTGCGSDRKK